MRKKFTIICGVFGLLAGCAEMNTDLSVTENGENFQNTENISSENSDSDVVNSILATIIDSDLKNDFSLGDNQPLVSSDTTQKYILEAPSEYESIYCHPYSEKQNSAPYIAGTPRGKNILTSPYPQDNYLSFSECYYLGKHDGKHVVFRRFCTGGTAVISCIWWCTLNDGKLHVDSSLPFGNRGIDGVRECPYLAPDGKVFFKISLSTFYFAQIAGLPNEQTPDNRHFDYWNSAEVVFDPQTNKDKILSMDIDLSKSFSDDINKMLKKIFPNQKSRVHIDEDHVDEFVEKFKAASIELFEEKRIADKKSSKKKSDLTNSK